MRFSTLTLVVFVAHTSTQAIAAPLPFYEDVQDLVARADWKNWASVASKLAQKVPAPLLNSHTGSDIVEVAQKAIEAVASAGPYRTGEKIPYMPPLPPPRASNPILEAWNEKTGNLFTQPSKGTPPGSSVHKVPKLIRRDPEIDEIDWVN